MSCQWPEWRSSVGIGSDNRDRIGQQRGTLRIGGSGAPGRHDNQRLALPKRMAFDGAQQGALIVLGQCAQGIGECRTDGSLVDVVLSLSRKPCCEGITAHNPGFTAAEEMCGGGQAQTVFVNEGLYDTSLIHGSGGTRRRVCTQEQHLVFR